MDLKLSIKMSSYCTEENGVKKLDNKQLDLSIKDLTKKQVQGIVTSINNVIGDYDKTYKIKTDYSIQKLELDLYDKESNILELFPEIKDSDVYEESNTIDMFQEDKEAESAKEPDSFEHKETEKEIESIETESLNNDIIDNSLNGEALTLEQSSFINDLITRINHLLTKKLTPTYEDYLQSALKYLADIKVNISTNEYDQEQFIFDINRLFPNYLKYIETLEKETLKPKKKKEQELTMEK